MFALFSLGVGEVILALAIMLILLGAMRLPDHLAEEGAGVEVSGRG
jgi:Sec-independent protein translocase protein TatA